MVSGGGKPFGRGLIGALAVALLAAPLASSPCLRRLVRNAWLPGIPEKLAPAYPTCSDAELIEYVSLVVTVKDIDFGGVAALAVASVAVLLAYSPCMRRLVRNAWLPGIPDKVPPAYPPCSDAELIESVSLVVTVKDTCAQAEELLTHLSTLFPAGMQVFYANPAIRGCRHVDAKAIGSRLFTTKYAVLMHNDAYPMERDFACEMFRALEANPHYPIAAPQTYEAAADKIIVPHGHHENLHVRPTASGNGLRIDYDLSLDLLTQRQPHDFKEGPQVDFLEDHAFFARSDVYHELLDPSASFTMEYMDMILNMRARNTSAWHVPTARCIFDVDTRKITWEDLPYIVYKRSEQIGHQVRTYLTRKWGVEFPNSGIWNYVRYVNLADVVIDGPAVPQDWKDQAAIFYSWFESVGFNRYNGQLLPEFIEEPITGAVNVSRATGLSLPADVPEHRIPPRSAAEILPHQTGKKFGMIEVAFREPHLPIGVRKRSCVAAEPASYAECGMAVQDGDECTCFNYVVPFNL
eukprot:CAMPEP_0170361224 /NCGR_PEP_ID=MMETSP0117_2-20130122/3694_1 /TAXON_ID=400756 /ORGANISM="Durinskia baltica, Strain CSIRO CS-38" /LENGTH=520 /DNA_ID=CAMNT_0010615579 /DNA_START=87 /DNA_END=1647 /DNA_ORIENTATION=+